ncbi:hypothetical protein GCM10007049_17970 [Echinicola pacifica]|uniref:Uncharacterized protein n=1 Tax=Echinicola pacifica TaxID=346377 RepID=A0A918PXX3_9BACT|nr:hypothetical protein [Echinicola pacifica]GGZ25811.1 hypothetical protein GCM10007049_17970 [Echinicola pacifica]
MKETKSGFLTKINENPSRLDLMEKGAGKREIEIDESKFDLDTAKQLIGFSVQVEIEYDKAIAIKKEQ